MIVEFDEKKKEIKNIRMSKESKNFISLKLSQHILGQDFFRLFSKISIKNETTVFIKNLSNSYDTSFRGDSPTRV